MKKLIAVLLWVMLLVSCGFAGESEYLERSCDCGETACVCFMQKGDFGLPVGLAIDVLKQTGYLDPKHSKTYDSEAETAVLKLQRDCGLPETGVLDDDTLTFLLWGMNSEQLDAEYASMPLKMVWVPTDGGKKYHNKKTCSQMYDPRKISQRNAIALGIEPCGRCAKADKGITYDSIIEIND